MSTQTRHPILEKIDERLLGLDQKPQFAWPPFFPFRGLEEVLKKLFSCPDLKLSHQNQGWEEGALLLKGMGSQIHALAFECAPITTPVFFLFNQEDLKGLMQEILGGEKVPAPFIDTDIASGFTQYLSIEILHFLESLKAFSPFSPKLTLTPDDYKELLLKEPHYMVNVSIKLERRVVWGRLLVSATFRDEWNKEAQQFPKPAMTKEQLEKFKIDIALVVGQTELSKAEWDECHTGDIIVLDKCHFFPQEGRGNITLFAGESALYRGKLKEGSLKLLDMLNFEEGSAPMSEEFEQDSFSEEEEKEPLEEMGSEEDGDFENETSEDESQEKEHIADAQFAPSQSKKNFDQLPITLHVELGRLNMTLLELTKLSAGNIVELPQEASQGVDLVVNGKRVGRGEVVKLGDALGVRILAL